MGKKKILLTEGSSLTARETLTALRGCGYQVDILSSAKMPMTRFSRWCHRIIRTVDVNNAPRAYLKHLARLVEKEGYVAIIPTHEQAWLVAEGRKALPPDFPVTVTSAAAFRHTQSKVSFAELLDSLKIPQPAWQLVEDTRNITLPFPLWLKSEYGTAGRSVRKVYDARQLAKAINSFPKRKYNRLMVQADVGGRYGQVQALFDRGRMVAVHTTLQTGVGAGHSAAARRSVDIPKTRRHIQRIGAHLGWHGPITVDFIIKNGKVLYIECNPRMVEPANAARAGVNFPDLLIKLTEGVHLGNKLRTGAAGVDTHSLQALLMGAAEQKGKRRALLHTLHRYAFQKVSAEVLTPVWHDPPSIIPLLAVMLALLISPRCVSEFTADAIHAYSVLPETIGLLQRTNDGAAKNNVPPGVHSTVSDGGAVF